MSDWWKIAFGVICGLLAAGLILLVSGAPRGDPITLDPPPTPAPIIVHVAGAVARPGVYTLNAGSRVLDAVQAAGGLLSDADQRALNLATILQDGNRILVPAIPPTPLPGSQVSPDGENPASSGHLINLNSATQAELESLPGIGPKTAQKIIEYREKNGPFQKIEDILNVPDIGPKTFEEIKDFITV
jgi:competence protein ComEA